MTPPGDDTPPLVATSAASAGPSAAPRSGAGGGRQRNGSSPANTHGALAGFDEAQIAAAREAVMDRVRRSFRGSLNEADVEDAAQEAWAALLAQERDEPIRDLAAFVAEVGWRSARAVTRRPRPLPLDPEDAVFADRASHASSPLDQVDDRARLARVVEALEQLSAHEREAFRLWFVEELEPVEACEKLGLSRSGYFKRLAAAKSQIEGAIELDSQRFSRTQRRLISDYVAGIAEGRVRARAERLIAADPQAAAMAREIRRAHEAAAAALPVLALFDAAHGVGADRLSGLIERARDSIMGLVGRGRDAADLAAPPVVASGGARGAGVAGLGLVAKALGGLGPAGVALSCVGGGVVLTAACVVTGMVSLPVKSSERPSEPPARSERSVERGPAILRASQIAPLEHVAPQPEPLTPPEPERDRIRSEVAPQASPADPVVAPTTPVTQEEFGVAGAATPVDAPAPADTDDGDGASAATVKQEFGP